MAALDQSGQARADWDQRVGRRRGPGLDSGAGRRPGWVRSRGAAT
jgi:hypothetical protein